MLFYVLFWFFCVAASLLALRFVLNACGATGVERLREDALKEAVRTQHFDVGCAPPHGCMGAQSSAAWTAQVVPCEPDQ